MSYSDKELRSMVIKAGNEFGNRTYPEFYAVSGSHLYGCPSPFEKGGDIDIRGFHIAPASRHANIGTVKEHYRVNQGTITEGFETWKHVELVSYELKKLAEMVYSSNFNAIEWLSADSIYGVTYSIDMLRDILNEHLPMDMASGYIGMAKSIWHGSNLTVKSYLYIIRALLAATYVTITKEVEPNINKLASIYGYTTLVDDLVATKQEDENAPVPRELANRADTTIESLLEGTEDIEPEFSHDERMALKDDLNTWMSAIRD